MNPFGSDLELRKFQQGDNESSDEDDLEPPFEIHGIQPTQPQPGLLDFADFTPKPLELPAGPVPPESRPSLPHSSVLYPPPLRGSQIQIQIFDSDSNNIVHESSDSDSEDAPPSMLYEQEQQVPLIPVPVPANLPIPPRNTRLAPHPARQQYDLSHVNRLNAGRTARKQDQPPHRSPVITGWKDVYNMDEFLQRLYEYYDGKGFQCIVLASFTNLLTVAFVVALTLFLTECVDYSLIPTSKKLEQVLVANCLANMSWSSTIIAFGVGSWWAYMVIRTVLYQIPKLLETSHFVATVLEISEQDLQFMLWKDFAGKIVSSYDATLRRMQGTGRKLDAHIIANRIMRKENYLIAMVNKDVLDLTVPGLGRGQWLTRMMQDYIIYYGVFGFVFDEKGAFRKRFLKETNKARLTVGLQRRFQKMALLSLALSPVLFVYLIVQSFFKLSEEYRQNPALLGARAYSPLANWKMREFNELPHIFNKRLTRSHEHATKYMNQFPNHLVVILARFVSFVSGSFATVLVIITLFEEEFQQGFEITPNRSALFYIGIFGSILAVTQGLTLENIVHEPQRWMNEVVLDTHYLPDEWRDRAHLPSVRDEFAGMFNHKLVLLLYELLSVLLVPIILYTSLPNCAGQIIDFVREFTVQVESIGHICSFAVFDFERHGNVKYGSKEPGGRSPADDHQSSKNGKLEQSFMNFKSNNPAWDPGNRGSEYLAKVIRRHPVGKSTLGPPLLSSRLLSMSHSEFPAHSMMQTGTESISAASFDEAQDDIARELVGLLDAFYRGNHT
ncbi:autophagy protein atg9 [Kappamyces sp. JEL0829]|nr:autophagy protein atg9 [Kappamyces sp. JEL0829]